MPRRTKKNGPVVNDLRKDLTNLLANLSLIDGEIMLASLSSSFFSGSSNNGVLDDYLSLNSGADPNSNFQSVSQMLTKLESFDSLESGRKHLFKKKAKRKPKVEIEESNMDGYKISDSVIIYKDHITKLWHSVYERTAGCVSRVTKSCVWILLDFNGEVKQKASHMVSH